MSGRYLGRHRCTTDGAISPAAINAASRRLWTRDEERQPDESEEHVAHFAQGQIERVSDEPDGLHLHGPGGKRVGIFRGRHKARMASDGGVDIFKLAEPEEGEVPVEDELRDENGNLHGEKLFSDSLPARLRSLNEVNRRFWRGRPAAKATTDSAALSIVTVAGNGPSNPMQQQAQIKAFNAAARARRYA